MVKVNDMVEVNDMVKVLENYGNYFFPQGGTEGVCTAIKKFALFGVLLILFSIYM